MMGRRSAAQGAFFHAFDLDDRMPHHSTFSENRLGRFRESDILRFVFECVVRACMARGLVKEDALPSTRA